MSSTRVLFRLVAGLVVAAVAAGGSGPTRAQPGQSERPSAAVPWGVSSSASAFKDHADWFPKMTAAGVALVRLFPEWRTFEPKKGTWHWDHGDTLVRAAADNKIEI